MAIKEVRECDVFPQSNDVHPVTVTLTRGVDGDDKLSMDIELDMSGRAYERLVNFVRRGTVSPKDWKSMYGAT